MLFNYDLFPINTNDIEIYINNLLLEDVILKRSSIVKDNTQEPDAGELKKIYFDTVTLTRT